jgi:hypothetical protein
VWKCVVNRAAEADPEKMARFRELCLNRGYIADNYVFIDEVETVSMHGSSVWSKELMGLMVTCVPCLPCRHQCLACHDTLSL